MQHKWDKLVAFRQITSEIIDFAPLAFIQSVMLLVPQTLPLSDRLCFEFVSIAYHAVFLH